MVENICHLNNVAVIIGRKLKDGKPFFHLPVPSTCFGIIQFSQEYGSLQTFPIHDIKNKAVLLPIFDPTKLKAVIKMLWRFPSFMGTINIENVYYYYESRCLSNFVSSILRTIKVWRLYPIFGYTKIPVSGRHVMSCFRRNVLKIGRCQMTNGLHSNAES